MANEQIISEWIMELAVLYDMTVDQLLALPPQQLADMERLEQQMSDRFWNKMQRDLAELDEAQEWMDAELEKLEGKGNNLR